MNKLCMCVCVCVCVCGDSLVVRGELDGFSNELGVKVRGVPVRVNARLVGRGHLTQLELQGSKVRHRGQRSDV